MPARDVPSPATSYFSHSQNESFQNANFNTAGQDIFMPILNFNVNKAPEPPGAGPSMQAANRLESWEPSTSANSMKAASKNRPWVGLRRLFRSKKRISSPLGEEAHDLSPLPSIPNPDQDGSPDDRTSPTVYESDGISLVVSIQFIYGGRL